jgi:hypothetical protein
VPVAERKGVRLTQRIAAALLSVGFVACYSTSLMQDTRVAPPGAGRVAIGGGVASARDRGDDAMVEAAIHIGVEDGLELQGKLSSLRGVEIGFKLALEDSGPFRLSLLGGAQLASVVVDMAGEAFSSTRTVAGLHAMPLFGFTLTRGIEVVVGPDLQVGTKSGESRFDPWFGIGGRAAIALDLGTHLTFIPECSVLLIAAGPPTRPGEYNALRDRTVPDSVFARGDVRLQCGASFNFGRPYAEPE